MNMVGQFALGACALAIVAPMFVGGGGFNADRSEHRNHAQPASHRAEPRNRVQIEGISSYEEDDDADEEENDAFGTAISYRGSNGHFSFEAEMNGEYVDVMVDTGASSVAINRSTAEQIGAAVSDADFVHTANTANGTTAFARITIDRITIGDITVSNVEASVLSDQSLDTVLLGMSFLKHVKMVTDGDRMVLTQ